MKVYIKKPWKEILIWGFVSPSVMYMFIEIYSKQIIAVRRNFTTA